MKPEIWLTVEGCPAYEVSDLGRVRRVAPGRGTRSGRIMSPTRTRDGYHRVNLGNGFQRMVHVLVLEAFVGPAPSPAHEGAHWDGIKTNNSLPNLRWATRHENAADRLRHGSYQRGATHACAKLSDEDVREIRRLAASGQRAADIAARFNINTVYCRDVARRAERREIL